MSYLRKELRSMKLWNVLIRCGWFLLTYLAIKEEEAIRS